MFTDEPNAAEPATHSQSLGAAAIVVARFDSQRLPGKVMRCIRGRPLLAWVLERLRQCRGIDRGIIVATSDRSVDDRIADYCRDHRVACFRGSAVDVSGRVLACADAYGLHWFARVNADSPFVDARLLESACRVAAEGQHDFVTNLSPRSFPYGVSAELVRVEAYRQAYARMWTPDHFEHVTKILYEKPDLCRAYNLSCPEGNLSDSRLTVDTADDWRTFSQVANRAGERGTPLSYQEAIQIRRSIREAA